jgi:hypothetical protein
LWAPSHSHRPSLPSSRTRLHLCRHPFLFTTLCRNCRRRCSGDWFFFLQVLRRSQCCCQSVQPRSAGYEAPCAGKGPAFGTSAYDWHGNFCLIVAIHQINYMVFSSSCFTLSSEYTCSTISS